MLIESVVLDEISSTSEHKSSELSICIRQGIAKGTSKRASSLYVFLKSARAPLSLFANLSFLDDDIFSPISHSLRSHQVAARTAAEAKFAPIPLGGF